MSEIPAVVINDQSEFGAWGRRLSENKLRSFNWQAECVCFARMRAEGRSLTEIATIFGLKNEEDVRARIAVGSIPNIKIDLDVSMLDAIRYLLPLRVETGRNPNDGNQRVYDYSEVTTCIDTLVSSVSIKLSVQLDNRNAATSPTLSCSRASRWWIRGRRLNFMATSIQMTKPQVRLQQIKANPLTQPSPFSEPPVPKLSAPVPS